MSLLHQYIQPLVWCICLFLLSTLHHSASYAEKKCGAYLKKERVTFEFSEQRWKLSAGPSDWINKSLTEISIECDDVICTDEKKALFIRTMSLPLDQAIQVASLERSWERLMQLGLFNGENSYFIFNQSQSSKDTNQYHLKICAENYSIIQKLSINYKSIWSDLYPKQFTSEIKKRLRLKRGGPFPTNQEILKKQEKQIISLYESLGYQGTVVQIISEDVKSQSKRVNVKVLIKEGVRKLIGAPLVKVDTQQAYSEIVQALTPDYFFDFWKDIFNLLGIGDYDRKELRERVQNYEMSLRRSGWISARVRVIGEIPDGKYTRPRLIIERGPKVKLFFEGNESLNDQELINQLTLYENGAFDNFELKQSQKKLLQHYQSTAHYYAQIDVKTFNHQKTEVKVADTQKNDPASSALKTQQDVSIVFDIEEGPTVYVSHFEFDGIHSISTDKVKEIMSTKEVGKEGVVRTFLASESVLQDVKIQQDLEKIRKYYLNQGFMNVSFRCQDPERLKRLDWEKQYLIHTTQHRTGPLKQFDLWSTLVNKYKCFKVIPDYQELSKRRFLTIKIELNEGKRTTVDRLNVDDFLSDMDGKMQDDLTELLMGMEFLDSDGQAQKRTGISRQKIEVIRDLLLRHLRRSGYLKAKITPICLVKDLYSKKLKRDVCNLEALYGKNIKELSFKTQLGPKAEVEGIVIRGNLDSHPELILHDLLLKEGESLSPDSIFLSQTSLRNLGLFRSVRIESITLDENDTQQNQVLEPVTLVVSVEEDKPKRFDLAVGLQLEDRQVTEADHDFNLMYTFNNSIEHKNINGYGLGAGFAFRHANLINTPLDIEGDKALWIIGPFLQHPRFLQTYWKMYTDIAYEQHISDQRDLYVKQYRGTIIFSYDFFYLNRMNARKGLRLDITGEIKQEQSRILSVLNERLPFREPTYSSSLGIKITQDRRNNPIHPTSGFFWSIGSEVLYSIQNNPDSFLTASEESNAVSIRSTFSTQAVFAWLKKRLIFAPTLRLGNLNTDLRDSVLPADFSFKAGGDQVTYPVRGYLDASIDACKGKENLNPNYQGICQGVYSTSDLAKENPQRIGGQTLMNANLELRFPTIIIPSVWLALFNDWAMVGETWKNIQWNEFYTSVGFGVRYLVLNQIPIRLDLAWPLKSTVFGYQQDMLYHFNIFYTF